MSPAPSTTNPASPASENGAQRSALDRANDKIAQHDSAAKPSSARPHRSLAFRAEREMRRWCAKLPPKKLRLLKAAAPLPELKNAPTRRRPKPQP